MTDTENTLDDAATVPAAPDAVAAPTVVPGARPVPARPRSRSALLLAALATLRRR